SILCFARLGDDFLIRQTARLAIVTRFDVGLRFFLWFEFAVVDLRQFLLPVAHFRWRPLESVSSESQIAATGLSVFGPAIVHFDWPVLTPFAVGLLSESDDPQTSTRRREFGIAVDLLDGLCGPFLGLPSFQVGAFIEVDDA